MAGAAQRSRSTSRGKESQNGRASAMGRAGPRAHARVSAAQHVVQPRRRQMRSPPPPPPPSPPLPPQRRADARARAPLAPWENGPSEEGTFPQRLGTPGGDRVMISYGADSTSSLESFYLRPSDILFSSPKKTFSSRLSQSSTTQCSTPTLDSRQRAEQTSIDSSIDLNRPSTAETENAATVVYPSNKEASLSVRVTSESETELEKLRSVSFESRLSGTSTGNLSSHHVRSLPPMEQAKLPRSAILAARLEAIPNIDYSKKYGFRPLKSPTWTYPRFIASSFLRDPDESYPYETPSYLKEFVRPISALKKFAKPWWMRVKVTPEKEDENVKVKTSKRYLDDSSFSESLNCSFGRGLDRGCHAFSSSSFVASTSSLH